MEWLRRFLNPRQSNFMELLIEQGAHAITIAEALQRYLKKPSAKNRDLARQIEKDADEVQRILTHELEDTFVTPLDREDIFALSRAIDNFIDYMYDTVDELEILQVPPSAGLQQLAQILYEMAVELHLALQRLEAHPRVANEHARRAKKLENRAEDAYRERINELFQGPEDIAHVMEMLKTREVLRHLSNAADQGDMAADVILDIYVKWN